MTEQFVEIFPIAPAAIPPLTAYMLGFSGGRKNIGGKLAYHLTRTSPGQWIWTDGHLLTDVPLSASELEIAIDLLHTDDPERYGTLMAIVEDIDWRITAGAQADFLNRTRLRDLEPAIKQALAQATISGPHFRIEREPRVHTHIVNDAPALALTLRSRILYEHDLQAVAARVDKTRELVGLWVMDKSADSMIGTIVRTMGKAGAMRDKLLSLTKRPEMQTIIQNAADDEPVLRVNSGRSDYDYVASALRVLIRPDSRDDRERFGINGEHLTRALKMTPAYRSSLVKVMSDIAKNAGLIDSAFNTRTHPDNFLTIRPNLSVQFANNRVRKYKAQTLANDFAQCGVFQKRRYFLKNPIRIAVINTLDEKIDDFIEAMRRNLERQYGFTVELIRERKVRKVSNKTLESAVKVVADENAHIVLAFFPDVPAVDDEEDEDYRRVKSLTLGRGIACHIIRHSTVHDPDSMATVVMGLLGKTGNSPYVLADPITYADTVVGLDIVRQSQKDADHITAIARIYDQSGQLLRYIVHNVELEPGDPIPLIVMQTLFPLDAFGGQRIVIHRDGAFSRDERELLTRWAGVLKAQFATVEIFKRGSPRLYALEKGVVQPTWGSAFKLNASEAVLVSSQAEDDATPRPLLIRVDGLAIDDGLHSVLVWTLLHYGMLRPPRLPVTVTYADEMARWLEKGHLPDATEADVPFWL